MRKTFLLLIGITPLLINFVLPANAQQAFYIYRNDGGFNAFFTDEVDSLTYSQYDADSIFHEKFVSQVVYTADSIYQIPLAVIDSVGFVTPETVFKPGVTKLDGEIRNYIVSSDSLSIYFMKETPNNILPKIGDYLFTEEVSSVFPAAFIGKVVNLNMNEEKWVVNCTQVGFEEVFDYYCYVSHTRIEGSRRRANPNVDEYSRDTIWSPGPYTFDLTNLISPNIHPDPMGDLAIEVTNQHSISLTPTFRVKYVRIVTPTRGTEVCLDITEEDKISGDLSMSGHISWSRDLISTQDIPFFQLGIPFLWLYGKAGVFVNAEATVSGERHWSQTYRYTFHCEGRSRNLFSTRASISGAHLESEHSGEIFAKGEIDLGIYGEIGVAFFDSNIASVAYRGEVGVGLEGNVMIYKKDAENALHSTDLYKTLQGNDIKFKWFYRSGLPVKLLWFSWPNEHQPHDNVLARVGLVPNFSNTKLERDPEDNSTLFASAIASGTCMPVDLGFTLFEQESTNSQPPSYSVYGYNGEYADLYSSFFNMPTTKKYEVYPTIKLLGIEMLADPKAKESSLCPDDNHPHMIDLGLPSGTKWACCNVEASKPEDSGGWFAWGYTSSFSLPIKYTHQYIEHYSSNEPDNITIGPNIAGSCYDAATVNWGAPWCMPTLSQCEELISICSSTWTVYNGVNGWKITGPNNASIFLPHTGYWSGYSYYIDNKVVIAVDTYKDHASYYSSSELKNVYNLYNIGFNMEQIWARAGCDPVLPTPVRPVCNNCEEDEQ